MTATPATRLARPRWWPAAVAWTVWALVIGGVTNTLFRGTALV